jgi:sugar lactone lactonase YvrE
MESFRQALEVDDVDPTFTPKGNLLVHILMHEGDVNLLITEGPHGTVVEYDDGSRTVFSEGGTVETHHAGDNSFTLVDAEGRIAEIPFDEAEFPTEMDCFEYAVDIALRD